MTSIHKYSLSLSLSIHDFITVGKPVWLDFSHHTPCNFVLPPFCPALPAIDFAENILVLLHHLFAFSFATSGQKA